MKIEISHIIKDHPKYQIYKDGRIQNIKSNKFIKPIINHKGYKQVSLYVKNRKYKGCMISRLIAQCWIENPENKPTVDHINRDKLDNRIENLRWATYKEQNKNRKKFIHKGFKKGGIPWNKGTKGLMKKNKGSFKKGNIPWNKRA